MCTSSAEAYRCAVKQSARSGVRAPNCKQAGPQLACKIDGAICSREPPLASRSRSPNSYLCAPSIREWQKKHSGNGWKIAGFRGSWYGYSVVIVGVQRCTACSVFGFDEKPSLFFTKIIFNTFEITNNIKGTHCLYEKTNYTE